MTTYPPPLVFRPRRYALSHVDPSQTSPAGAEPVTLADMKAHLRVDGTDEDDLIADLIRAARQKVEKIANRALINQAWTFKLDRFPWAEGQIIELPGGTLQSVESITYIDADGATQTWGTSNYVVDTAHVPGRVGLAYDKDWPTIREWGLPVTISYTVGFGAEATDVPGPLVHAMKMIAGHWHANREATEMPMAVKALTAQYRLHPGALSAA